MVDLSFLHDDNFVFMYSFFSVCVFYGFYFIFTRF